MPVTRLTAGQQGKLLAGNLSSHDMDVPLNVNPNAAPYTYGIAAYGWKGGVSVSGDPLTCTWAGATMTPLLSTPLLFSSNESVLMGWIIESPAAGSAYMTHTGIGTSLLDTRSRFFAAGVWSQAEPLDLPNITASVVTATGTATTGSVTVPSVLPASRVIAAHLVRGRKITAYNGARVAAPATSDGGGLILGECRGAASVTSTTTHSASAAWAAFALNLDPAPLAFGANGKMRAGKGLFGASVYRLANPHPDREYTVPPIGSANDKVAGSFLRSADGVLMPVWAKDPDDTLDYTLHWQNHLADDDEITHVEHDAGGSLRVVSSAHDGVSTQVWISGSTISIPHAVRVRVSTKRGRRHDRTFRIVGAQN